MSLYIYLTGKTTTVQCECRHCGNEHQREDTEEFFAANITHNLGRMAEQAGIYQHLWRPKELDITKAQQLVGPLTTGLALMLKDPERFQAYNSPNGWGMYEHFIPWLRRLLEACEAHPDAELISSR